MLPISQTLVFAIGGGLLPAVIWLMFWTQEDSKNPEPSRRIFGAFALGALAVPVVLSIQLLFSKQLIDGNSIESLVGSSLLIGFGALFLWAIVEELFKYLAANFAGISTRDGDEAIDVMVYMISAALGFAAIENTLYIISPLLEGDTTTAILTGNMRFIGATLVHVASSAVLGYFIATSFFKYKKVKQFHFFTGLLVSTCLHALFNLFIIVSNEKTMILSLVGIWTGCLILFILFEKIKKVHLNKM